MGRVKERYRLPAALFADEERFARVVDANIALVASSRSPVRNLRNSFSACALRVAGVSPRRIKISCVDNSVLLMSRLAPALRLHTFFRF